MIRKEFRRFHTSAYRTWQSNNAVDEVCKQFISRNYKDPYFILDTAQTKLYKHIKQLRLDFVGWNIDQHLWEIFTYFCAYYPLLDGSTTTLYFQVYFYLLVWTDAWHNTGKSTHITRLSLQDFGNRGRSNTAHFYLMAFTAATRTVWFYNIRFCCIQGVS
jgi:hypothetical protein